VSEVIRVLGINRIGQAAPPGTVTVTSQPAPSPAQLSGTAAPMPPRASAQTESILETLTLLFRGGGAILTGAATFGYSAASGRALGIEAVAFAIGAVAVAYWLVADLRPGHRQPRVLAGALIVMAAASGFASMGAHGGPLVGFAFMAAIGAGAGSSLLTGCVTTAVALVGVEAGAPRSLPPEATVALIRTAQEALVNTAKHAPAQPVDIGLDYGQDGVQMIISNPLPSGSLASPGPGTAFGTVNGGYGLRGMRERLLLIGGSLSAAPGDGRWTVTAQVPR
jgi:hypothetical protein